MPNPNKDFHRNLFEEINSEIEDIRNDLKSLLDEEMSYVMKDLTKIIGPYPAPAHPKLKKKTTVRNDESSMPRRQNYSEESLARYEHEQNKKEDFDNPSEDFNKTLCELYKLQEAFIKAQIKYKAFPK